MRIYLVIHCHVEGRGLFYLCSNAWCILTWFIIIPSISSAIRQGVPKIQVVGNFSSTQDWWFVKLLEHLDLEDEKLKHYKITRRFQILQKLRFHLKPSELWKQSNSFQHNDALVTVEGNATAHVSFCFARCTCTCLLERICLESFPKSQILTAHKLVHEFRTSMSSQCFDCMSRYIYIPWHLNKQLHWP